MRLRSAALLYAAIALAACKPRVPTYHRDVAPIIERHCRECHRAGGIAPVPLLDGYASAKMYAQPMKYAVQTRRMPPWGVDDTGLCGTWEDARWLTTDEIATLARWEANGAPEGSGRSATPQRPAEPPFRSDATLDIGGAYEPLLGAGYRCFIADPRLDRDRLLGAIRVLSTDARAVAQVTLFALDSEAAEAQASALDAADEGLGYACFGTARVRDARLVASWTWPRPVLRMPAGTGTRLRANRKIVVQIHYDITQALRDYRARTTVDLELDDGVREARVLKIEATGSLPPAQRYVAIEHEQPVDRRLRVVGAAARMHIRGQVLDVAVEHGGRSQCLADFDHWHFYSQQLFRARRPMLLEPNDRVRISCAYGTLGRSQPIVFGDGIDDEECVAYLFVTDD